MCDAMHPATRWVDPSMGNPEGSGSDAREHSVCILRTRRSPGEGSSQDNTVPCEATAVQHEPAGFQTGVLVTMSSRMAKLCVRPSPPSPTNSCLCPTYPSERVELRGLLCQA